MFSEWLDTWKDEIEAVQLFTKSELPKTAGEIQRDVNRTTSEYARVPELLADVEGFIISSRAAETLSVRRECPDLAAAERKAIVEAKLAPMIRVRDMLKATVRALHQRSFALMSQRAYEREAIRFGGNHEG